MKKRMESRPPTPRDGETVRRVVAWAIDAAIVANWTPHGNTRWQALDRIRRAVGWVWSANATLTGAFAEARAWSRTVPGRVAVGTDHGFFNSRGRERDAVAEVQERSGRRRRRVLLARCGGAARSTAVGAPAAPSARGSAVDVAGDERVGRAGVERCRSGGSEQTAESDPGSRGGGVGGVGFVADQLFAIQEPGELGEVRRVAVRVGRL